LKEQEEINHKDHKATKAAHKEHKIKFFIKNFKVLKIANSDKF
jgi:hypothetical protein